MKLKAVAEEERWLQTLQGQQHFIALHLHDEVTQTSQTNFLEYTLNQPTNPCQCYFNRHYVQMQV